MNDQDGDHKSEDSRVIGLIKGVLVREMDLIKGALLPPDEKREDTPTPPKVVYRLSRTHELIWIAIVLIVVAYCTYINMTR